MSPNTIDSEHFEVVNLGFCPQKIPSVLLTLLPENILLSAPSVFWVETPNMWWLSNQGKNQAEFRQIDPDSNTSETVTVSQEWKTPSTVNSSSERPGASPKHTNGKKKACSKVKITQSVVIFPDVFSKSALLPFQFHYSLSCPQEQWKTNHSLSLWSNLETLGAPSRSPGPRLDGTIKALPGRMAEPPSILASPAG